jgi:hypothetical protein
MELEELKASWEKVGEKIEKQLNLNSKLIEKMTHQNYQNRLKHIAYPEMIGSAVCLTAAVALILEFSRFDSAPLQIFAGLSVLVLVGLPIVSYRSLMGFSRIDLGSSTYADTIRAFTDRKIRFQKLQKLNIGLSSVLVVAILPTAVRLMSPKDITQHGWFWLLALPLSLLLQYVFSKWVFRHYNRLLRQAEAVLAEFEN